MRTTVILATLALQISACSDDSDVNSITDGAYVGTFTIVSANGHTQTGNVTFTFEGTSYSCLPEQPYLPPSGAGQFQTIREVLRFKDTVVHTAEFDWTLILNGDFQYTFDGSHLVLLQKDDQYHRLRNINLTRQSH